jgi:ferredoxin, 2Fe-2S
MAKITFIEADGSEHVVDGKVGNSLMETAIHNGIRGLLAECGGACSCATCHVYIEAQWVSAVGEPGRIEQDMLEMVVHRAACSRLACQVMVRADYDGLVVRIPESQV